MTKNKTTCSLITIGCLCVVLVILTWIGGGIEPFQCGKKGKKPSCLYLAGPTKCFSCERDLIQRYGCEYAYLGQPTRCFDCEKQLHASMGPDYANLGQPTKCFSCERELQAQQPRLTSFMSDGRGLDEDLNF